MTALLQSSKNKNIEINLNSIKNREAKYQNFLITELHKEFIKSNGTIKNKTPKAQFIFCIDVRSEPFRRAVESEGDYETFGFAGFFGIPMNTDSFNSEVHASCPVLLKPVHTVNEGINSDNCSNFKKVVSGNEKLKLTQKIYQSLKYNFTTPFLLPELLGFWSGLWMMLKTFFPIIANDLKKNTIEKIRPTIKKSDNIDEMGILESIPFSDQLNYAENMLRTIDLVKDFSPIILLCGHGSSTVNNAYGSSLDCGACGGHDGAPNARVMAAILNSYAIRNELKKRGVNIPTDSKFIAALHNTTTDDLTLFSSENYLDLEKDFNKAKIKNNSKRMKNLFCKKNLASLSVDWAQTRPEWGLAKNAAFIIAPRDFTKTIDLDARCFLHSYNFNTDKNLEMLTTILTAPMIVAQWINCQYLFSTLDPIAYGSGSKVTQNFTGKIGVMQGNGSDLMHGLPLQSTHRSDVDAYHEPLRLITIIYAPRNFITNVIIKNLLLEKLAKNEWVKFCCIDPRDRKVYLLKTDLEWHEYEHIQQY
ncbi:MAG: Na-translocating system protein MpsB [Gammaproteobacteria bacterium]|nr:Na-translocating system protein MpsB [Gammaproteobacteria bacterium]